MTWRLTSKLGISCPALKQFLQALWLRVLPWNTPFLVSSCSQQKCLLLTCGNVQWELFSCWLSCLGQPWDWKVLTWDRNVAHSPCHPPDCRRGHASLQAAQSSDMHVPWARCHRLHMLHPEVNKSPLGYMQLLQGWKDERVCYERGGWHSTKQCDGESCWSPLSQPTAGM